METRTSRLYWPIWAAAAVTTGLVAGFMLSHALLLGRYLDWLLASGRAKVLADTYPVFARSAGSAWLDAYYAVAGLQILAALAFAVVSIVTRRHGVAGVIVGAAAVLWPVMHYASGFGALEAAVLRSTVEVPGDVAARFIRWNGPIHFFHAATLGTAFGVLLWLPRSTRST